MESSCLGSQHFGIYSNEGTNVQFLAIVLINLSYYLNRSAFLEIYNRDPALKDDYNIGKIEEV